MLEREDWPSIITWPKCLPIGLPNVSCILVKYKKPNDLEDMMDRYTVKFRLKNVQGFQEKSKKWSTSWSEARKHAYRERMRR